MWNLPPLPALKHCIVPGRPLGIFHGQMGGISGLQIGNQGRVHKRIGVAEQSAIGESEPLIGIVRLVHREGAGALRGIDLRASRAASENQRRDQFIG